MKFQPYARVSTDDKDQDTERQLRRFREWLPPDAVSLPPISEDRSASVEEPFTRPGWRKACEAARDADAILLVEDADRITRLGCFVLGWAIIEAERKYGVKVWFSLFEPTVEAQESFYAHAMLAFKAEAGVEENRKLRVRTAQGMEVARAKGRIIGRPRKELTPEEIALALRRRDKDGWGSRRIANELSERRGAFKASVQGKARRKRTVSANTVTRALQSNTAPKVPAAEGSTAR